MHLGTDRPALKYLYKYVKADIAPYWYDIGVALLDPGDEIFLDTIDKDHSGKSNKCAAEMFRLWLARKPKASWGQLLKAFREPNVGLNALAATVEKMLCKGMLAVYRCMYSGNRGEVQKLRMRGVCTPILLVLLMYINHLANYLHVY